MTGSAISLTTFLTTILAFFYYAKGISRQQFSCLDSCNCPRLFLSSTFTSILSPAWKRLAGSLTLSTASSDTWTRACTWELSATKQPYCCTLTTSTSLQTQIAIENHILTARPAPGSPRGHKAAILLYLDRLNTFVGTHARTYACVHAHTHGCPHTSIATDRVPASQRGAQTGILTRAQTDSWGSFRALTHSLVH